MRLALIGALCAAGFAPQPLVAPAKAAASASALAWTPPSPAYRVYVDADGLYRLDYAYLSGAGLPVDSIDPATFRMFYMGEEVPILVKDGGDSRFDAGDAIFFYGRSVDSLFLDGLVPTNIYTASSVFWLSYGGAAGLRMAERVAATEGALAPPHPRRRHIERQYWYRAARPMTAGADHWFADTLQSSSTPGQRSYSFTDATLPAGTFSGQLQVSVVGNRDGPHHLRVYLNSTLLIDDTTSWSDNTLFQPVVSFDQSALIAGQNSVRIQLISDVGGKLSDSAYTDFVDVVYGDTYEAESDVLPFTNPSTGDWQYVVRGFSTPDIEVYDVTSLTGVSRIVGGNIEGDGPYSLSFGDSSTGSRRYLAQTTAASRTPAKIEFVSYKSSSYTPADITASQIGADYIIITHPDFWDQALDLAPSPRPPSPSGTD